MVAACSIAWISSPEDPPGGGSALSSAAGNRLYLGAREGPVVSVVRTTEDSGAILPSRFFAHSRPMSASPRRKPPSAWAVTRHVRPR